MISAMVKQSWTSATLTSPAVDAGHLVGLPRRLLRRGQPDQVGPPQHRHAGRGAADAVEPDRPCRRCSLARLLVGEDQAGGAVGVGAAVVDAERRGHRVGGQRLLQRDLLPEQGVRVHGAVVVVLDRHLRAAARGWCRTRACAGWRTWRSRPGKVVPKTDSHCTSPTRPIRARISAVASSVIFWQPITATTSCSPDWIAIQAVRIAALPEAQATSVSQVGFGVEAQVLLHHAGHASAACGTRARRRSPRRRSSSRSMPGVLHAPTRKASKASSCTVASLRRAEAPVADADDSDSCHRSPPPILRRLDVLPAVDLDHLAGDVPRPVGAQERRPGGRRPRAWRSDRRRSRPWRRS